MARQLPEVLVLLSQPPVVRWTSFWQGWMVAEKLGHVDICDFLIYFFFNNKVLLNEKEKTECQLSPCV